MWGLWGERGESVLAQAARPAGAWMDSRKGPAASAAAVPACLAQSSREGLAQRTRGPAATAAGVPPSAATGASVEPGRAPVGHRLLAVGCRPFRAAGPAPLRQQGRGMSGVGKRSAPGVAGRGWGRSAAPAERSPRRVQQPPTRRAGRTSVVQALQPPPGGERGAWGQARRAPARCPRHAKAHDHRGSGALLPSTPDLRSASDGAVFCPRGTPIYSRFRNRVCVY